MILGISFLEAPLKFMAPGVTPEIGLSIGRKVFGVFNKIECAMALAMAILILIVRQKTAGHPYGCRMVISFLANILVVTDSVRQGRDDYTGSNTGTIPCAFDLCYLRNIQSGCTCSIGFRLFRPH